MQSTWMLYAPLTALFTSLLAVEALRIRARHLGLLDRPDQRKRHVGAVPLVGGIAIYLGVLLGAWCVPELTQFSKALLCGAGVMVLLGTLDDRLGLSVRSRLLVQTVTVLAIIAATGVYVRSFGVIDGVDMQLGWIGVPVTVIAMIGLLNAFNLVDGIDGLAGGLALVAIGAILLFRRVPVDYDVPVLLLLMGAALLPYLATNLGLFGRKIFLGDAGSLLLGFVIGWALIRSSESVPTGMTPADVLWCVAVPVLDTLAVMVHRMRSGRSPFSPDRGHIHHRLLESGLGPRTTLVALLLTAIVLAAVGALVHQFGQAASLIVFGVLTVIHIVATGRFAQALAALPQQPPSRG
jgi:UDP-GlcNAc:undecaprenyl-phosphate GlcNAc-1-phosphate transferase